MNSVLQAFLAYWRGYLTAVNTGDTSDLSKAASGDELAAVQNGLKKVHSFGWHSLVAVVNQPSPTIDMPNQTVALVDDATTTRDQLVDDKGRVLNDSEHTEPLIREVHLQDGVWKVTRVWRMNQASASPAASASAAASPGAPA